MWDTLLGSPNTHLWGTKSHLVGIVQCVKHIDEKYFCYPWGCETNLLDVKTERRLHEKKVAVLLYFVQIRGGSALPKFFVHFSQTVYIGSIWGWGGRGRPLAKFFLAYWRSKKVVQVVHIRGRGRGVEVIWTKSKRTATFFGKPSLGQKYHL